MDFSEWVNGMADAHRKYLMKEHSKQCEKMYEDIIKGDGFYFRLVNKYVDGNEYRLEFSILSDDMLNYDRKMLNEIDKIDKIDLCFAYRPYFCEFISDYYGKDQLSGMLDKKKLLDHWYKGCFQTSGNSSPNDIGLDGILVFSASPLVYSKRSLHISDEVDEQTAKEIESCYALNNIPVADNEDVQCIIDDCWQEDRINKINIYNVGHGNCDYIVGRFHRILYDIGMHYRVRRGVSGVVKEYPRASLAIRNIVPDVVILSHWDMDHVLGCVYAKQSLFEKVWIAPDTIRINKQIGAKRLAKYLYRLGNLRLVSSNVDEPTRIACVNICKAQNTHLTLWMGHGSDSKITDSNRRGLFLEIDMLEGESIAVLAGDVPYNCMPNSILTKDIKFLHVPHHGSDMAISNLKRINKQGKGICAIISEDEDARGCIRCDNKHKKILEEKFDAVIGVTENIDHYDQANLSVSINYSHSPFDIC